MLSHRSPFSERTFSRRGRPDSSPHFIFPYLFDMCGIVGALSPSPIDPEVVVEMRDRLVHRGPDHAGLWQSEKSKVCLGSRRLSVVDLSPEANQPFCSHDGRYVLVYNGEIYNFKKLRKELTELGSRFRTTSDTEVLIEAYRHWGTECLHRFAGMFAFALWDTAERHLFCARDRVGEKPFYYATASDGSLLFASELKALLPWPGFSPQISYPALIDYLTFGFVADPKSIWEGTHKLPPGHSMRVEFPPGAAPRVSTPQQYWDFTFRPDPTETNWDERIRATLKEVSQDMAFADVPVGSFLSGGVDSSSVTAALSKSGCSVQTFTIGFPHEDYDERKWARLVANQYETEHMERLVEADDIPAVFDRILWHYDEPFNDYSYLPTFYLCREARHHITVALSGDGGDELFAGYLKYQRLGLMERLQSIVPPAVRRLVATGMETLLPETSSVHRTAYQYGRDSAAALTDMLMLVFPIRELERVARGPLAEALNHYSPLDTVRSLLENAPPQEVGLINTMRYLDLKLTLAGDILVKVDRASMAASLEVRPVYLHRKLLDLAEQIPSHRLANRSHSKKQLKSALSPWLPEPLLYRSKQGFAMPLEHWLREADSPLFGGGFSERLAPILDVEALSTKQDFHRNGTVNATAQLHGLHFLQHWLEKWT